MKVSKNSKKYIWYSAIGIVVLVLSLFLYKIFLYQSPLLYDEAQPTNEETTVDDKQPENVMLRYLDPARKPVTIYTGAITNTSIENNTAIITLFTDEQKEITLKYNLDQNTIVIHRLSADQYFPFSPSYQFGQSLVTILEYPQYQGIGKITIQLE